jgi:hypothetical protein
VRGVYLRQGSSFSFAQKTLAKRFESVCDKAMTADALIDTAAQFGSARQNGSLT